MRKLSIEHATDSIWCAISVYNRQSHSFTGKEVVDNVNHGEGKIQITLENGQKFLIQISEIEPS